MISARILALAGCPIILLGCSAIPDVPNDSSLPIREIIHNATCELRQAFFELKNDKKYSSFAANNWLIGLNLTPKTDREISGGIGLTGKSTTASSPNYFNSWALGSTGAPGAAVDVKGTRNAGVYFNIHSRDLLNTKKFPLVCDPSTPADHVLARHLGIHEWLTRSVLAQSQSVGSLAKLDKPSFSSEIVVKFSGGGNFTYNFPFGTDFASLTGNYDLDLTLAIALTADQTTTTITVQTLPNGGTFGNRKPDQVVTVSSVDAQSRLDALQQQQQIVDTLKNIQTHR